MRKKPFPITSAANRPSLRRQLMLATICMCIGVNLSGCGLAIEAASTVADAERSAFKDVDVTLSRGVSIDDVQAVDGISFIDVPEASLVFTTNLEKELINEGFNVVDSEQFQAVLEQERSTNPRRALANAGRLSGVDAVLKGGAKESVGFKRGFFGIGSDMLSGVNSVVFRMVDAKTAKVMLVVSVSYKKPKPPDEAAKDVAKAFRQFQQNAS